jgi:hypothetical protein
MERVLRLTGGTLNEVDSVGGPGGPGGPGGDAVGVPGVPAGGAERTQEFPAGVGS